MNPVRSQKTAESKMAVERVIALQTLVGNSKLSGGLTG